ncbi:amidase [Rhodovulum sp.]|uniref:amidase n=1 Tax=Rhodovulum sp. TaxID=34009 RepID=UPI0017EF6758|nr:amidase family protein [Rhodovulum sp.]HDR29055.1 amidase [Rhodovulum sp.]
MTGNWRGMSAGDLGRGIGAGRIDPVDLTDACLEAIAAHPGAGRIYARLTEDRARAEALAARDRARTGHRLGPLDGVPISWKDLFDTAGVATEAGSALLAGRVPGRDAEVLANASAAGLVCLGKTHMTELAFSGLGLNPVTATPPNVHDAGAAPGGSSSGAAASVAFGLAAAGIGSDTGGSVRVPAVWNDLVGLKTGAGRLPLAGVVPLCPRFDTVGPLTRNVEDAALLLAALEGGKPADLRGATLAGARLMVLETVAFDDIREAPATGFEQAVDRLARAGATITRAKVPEIAEALALSGVLFVTEAYATWRETMEAAPERMYPAILERFRVGREYSGAEYVAAWQTLDRLRAAFAAASAGFDAVLVPTCPILPPKVAALMADPELFVAENLMTLRNTQIGNLMGLAVLTLPTGVPSTGLSLMGPPMSEERLLRLGAAAEAALA